MSRQALRGYSHELLFAEAVVAKSGGKAWISTRDSQKVSQASRKLNFEKLSELFPADVSKIGKVAAISADKLPEAVGEVCFTEKSSNGGHVYDVYYRDADGENVLVSCKLSKMEDKAYRFSSKDYLIVDCVEILRKFFNEDTLSRGLTFLEALTEKGESVATLQKMIVESLENSLLDETDGSIQTKEMMLKLISERFIGEGGFWKTLPNGDVIYYPAQTSGSSFVVDEDTVRTSRTAVIFEVDMVDADGDLIQRYEINFRVKFKDGVKKPVRLSAEGYPTNFAATVKVTMI